MIPARIKKKKNTLKKAADPAYVPKAVESQPLVDSKRDLTGDKISEKIKQKNVANANNTSAVQRIAGMSLKSFDAFLLIITHSSKFSSD